MSRIREADLHAYVDDRLDPDRCAEVEAYLAVNPAAQEQVQAYRRQNEMLHAIFDPVLEERVPFARLKRRSSALRYAAALAWIMLGGAIGWTLRGEAPPVVPSADFPHEAAIAHAVYAPEVRHPVEVGADQEAHLVAWLSKRLGGSVQPPKLTALGYELVGGRLLPGDDGPAAQFMYQDGKGQRITLYVRTDSEQNRETAFRFAREGKVSVFYWIDGKFGYALSGELPRAELLQVANTIYNQLNFRTR